ncbi:MAG TPA: hypothetical protein VF451_05920 [Acidobacteriota bacterium]
MDNDHPKSTTLYRDKKPRRTLPRISGFLPLLLVLLLLIHFFNLFLQWTVIRQELAHGPAFRSPEYTFLGFSLFNQKKIAAVRLLPNAAPAGRVFGFFDLVHPADFLIWNNGPGEDFFDLGPVIIAVPAGASRVTFFPGSVFLLQQGGRKTARYFGDAIVGRAWYGFLSRKIANGEKKVTGAAGSFVVKERQQSLYLKTPYLIYFFLPLLLILIAIGSSGAVMASAFLYYIEMFFLFDYQELFAAIPLGWAFRVLNIEISDFRLKLVSALLALFFLACAVYGLWHWKRREISSWQMRIVLLFLLLPWFLFF